MRRVMHIQHDTGAFRSTYPVPLSDGHTISSAVVILYVVVHSLYYVHYTMLQLSLVYDVTFLSKTNYITTLILILLNLTVIHKLNFSLMKCCAIPDLQTVFCTQFIKCPY